MTRDVIAPAPSGLLREHQEMRAWNILVLEIPTVVQTGRRGHGGSPQPRAASSPAFPRSCCDAHLSLALVAGLWWEICWARLGQGSPRRAARALTCVAGMKRMLNCPCTVHRAPWVSLLRHGTCVTITSLTLDSNSCRHQWRGEYTSGTSSAGHGSHAGRPRPRPCPRLCTPVVYTGQGLLTCQGGEVCLRPMVATD